MIGEDTEVMRPLLIVSAARSGTKILRATLATSPEFIDFPYDINYIWKYGNYDVPHDELTVEHARPEVVRFIRTQFDKLQTRGNGRRVLEKSVTNSLRVPFVRAVYPEARIVHLFRNGMDVAADARLCWQSPATSERNQSRADMFKKLREFPVAAGWPYLLEYARNNTGRLLGLSRRVRSWGPRFEGIDEEIERRNLLEVCGLQWARSVSRSVEALSSLREGEDYLNVRYEDLVSDPKPEIERIASFAGVRHVDPIMTFAEERLSPKFIGSWRRNLTQEEARSLETVVGDSMRLLGYPTGLE